MVLDTVHVGMKTVGAYISERKWIKVTSTGIQMGRVALFSQDMSHETSRPKDSILVWDVLPAGFSPLKGIGSNGEFKICCKQKSRYYLSKNRCNGSSGMN